MWSSESHLCITLGWGEAAAATWNCCRQKKFLKIPYTVAMCSLFLFFLHPLCLFSIPLHLLSTLYPPLHLPHSTILLRKHTLLPRWISSFFLPSSLHPPSFSSSALPPFLLATLFRERTGSLSRLLLARVVSRQIKNGWTCRALVLFSCIKLVESEGVKWEPERNRKSNWHEIPCSDHVLQIKTCPSFMSVFSVVK